MLLMKRIIFFVYNCLLLTSVFLFFHKTNEVFEFNKIVSIYLGSLIIVGLWGMRMVKERKILFRRTILDLPLLFFITTQFISTIFSINVLTSIFGYYSRFNGGLLSTLAYSVLYWGWVGNFGKEETLIFLRNLAVVASLVSIWATFEHFGHSFSCLLINQRFDTSCWIQDTKERVFATFGQPNWLAAWLVFVFPVILSHFDSVKKRRIWIWIVCFLVFLALFYTKSRSGMIGLWGGMIVYLGLLVYAGKKKYLVNVIKLCVFLVVLWILLTGLQTQQSTKRTASAENGAIINITESGNIRKIVWRGAIKVWQHYPIFGSGVETFAYSYWQFRPTEHNTTSEWDFIYNKAHNEYLNFAANSGMVGLVSYLGLIFFSLYQIAKGFKKTNDSYRHINFGLAGGYIGFLVTNFFGFSTSATSFLFFLYPALAFSIQAKNIPKLKDNYKFSWQKKMMIGLIFVLMAIVTKFIFNYWAADYYYAQGNIKLATLLNPLEPIYRAELANQYALDGRANEAIKTMNKAIAMSPRNSKILEMASNMYIDLGEKDEKYYLQALQILDQLETNAPTNAKVVYIKALTKMKLGLTQEAIELLEKTVVMKADYKKARVALGWIYQANGDLAKAKEQYLYVLEHIDPNDQFVKDSLEKMGASL